MNPFASYLFSGLITLLIQLKAILLTCRIAPLLALFIFPIHGASGGMAVGEILPLGDSITDGEGGPGGGYRARLHFLLNNAGDLFNSVGSATDNSTATLTATGQHHHEGHSGYRIDQIRGNLTGLVSSAPVNDSSNGGHWFDGGHGTGRAAIFPDLILLHIGTNDATQGRTAAQMQSLLQGLLTEIKNYRPNAQVIVASLILRTDNSSREATQVAYNNGIPGTVSAAGSNFHFLDMHAVLNAGDLVDGVHPTQSGYDKMANAWSAALHSIALVEPLSLATAVSRRSHGPAGSFDVALPLSGAPGVECRSATAGDTRSMVFTLTNKVVSGSASVTAGNGMVSGSPVFAGNVMSVNLTGVADAQQITVTLSNVTDAYSQVLGNTPVKVNVLLGDTTGNKMVNSSDISQTKSQSGLTVTEANFREDLTGDGAINSSDLSLVKARSGRAIP